MASSRPSVLQSRVHDASPASAIGPILYASAVLRRPAGIRRRRLIRRPQRLHERDQRSYFRGTQILSIRRHVSASLDDLPDELIARETGGHGVQGRAAQTAFAAKAVTIAALLALDENRTLEFQRRASFHVRGRCRCAAPRLPLMALEP